MADFPTTVTTDRLIAQPCRADRDLDGFAPMFAREEVASRMWPAHLGGARTRDQTHAWLQRFEAHWISHGFGPWTVRERDGGALVGHVGLGYTVVAGAAEVELGAIIDPDHWGRGYAIEIGRLSLEHAPSVRGLESVVAFAMPDNARALNVIEACGFDLVGDTVVVQLPHRLYRRTVA